MLKTKIMGLNINYEFSNINSEITIVLLHGWGQNIRMMMPFVEIFNKNFNVLTIDFPGFGDSEEPKHFWSIYDYTKCIRELIIFLKIKKRGLATSLLFRREQAPALHFDYKNIPIPKNRGVTF